VREKLTSLYNARTQAVLDTLSVRETVSSFENLLDEATADLALAPDAQRNIAEERNLITTEIAKLGRSSAMNLQHTNHSCFRGTPKRYGIVSRRN